MKIRVIIILISFGVLIIGGLIMIRLTHIVDSYRLPSMSNAPTYMPGSVIFASRLKKPDRNAFICFKQPKRQTSLFRCIAKGGDIIEIKEGLVYLNNKLLNEPYTWNEYYITQGQLKTIQGYVDKYNYPIYPIHDSIYTITFSATDAKKYNLNLKRITTQKGKADTDMFIEFRIQNYNADNFGPLKIPKDSYFLLGDNRHNALDSRYLGLIKKEEIVSTVIR